MSNINDLSAEELQKRVKWYEERYGPYVGEKGFKNWKNLFRKPTLYEYVIFFMLVMGLFIAWAYQRDISLCRQIINNQQEQLGLNTGNYYATNPLINITGNITLKEANQTKTFGIT